MANPRRELPDLKFIRQRSSDGKSQKIIIAKCEDSTCRVITEGSVGPGIEVKNCTDQGCSFELTSKRSVAASIAGAIVFLATVTGLIVGLITIVDYLADLGLLERIFN